MEQNRNKFIYVWKMKNNHPFYIGQGTKNRRGKLHTTMYKRAYDIHYSDRDKTPRILAVCQLKANKLIRMGEDYNVEIFLDDLTKEEADIIETVLIEHYGRVCFGCGILYNISAGPLSNDYKGPIKQTLMLEFPDMPVDSPEEITKRRQTRGAEVRGVKIEYCGMIFESKAALSRYLGMSKPAMEYRLNNDIPLDAPTRPKERMGRPRLFFDGVNKMCKDCEEIKSVAEFYKTKDNNSGYTSKCKDCLRGRYIRKELRNE